MNNAIDWFTRKTLVLTGLVSLLFFLVLFPRKVLFSICSTHNSFCISFVNYLLMVLLFGIAIFIPSVIMFFVRQETFEYWKRLTFKFYLFIYLFILIFIPWYWGDEFLHIQKDVAAFSVSVLYVVYSLVFILYRSIKKASYE